MNNFTTVNRLRLNTLLREHGLDQPLDDHELALQLLSTELRLKKDEELLAIIEEKLQERGFNLYDEYEEVY